MRCCWSATGRTPILSPILYALSSSASSSHGQCSASAAELHGCLIKNGSRSSRASTVSAMVVWNHRSPVETFMSLSIHEDRFADVHPVSPRVVRSPYWRGVSAASVSSGGSAVRAVAPKSRPFWLTSAPPDLLIPPVFSTHMPPSIHSLPLSSPLSALLSSFSVVITFRPQSSV